MTKYKVHPAADVWPMLPKEELAAMAADIKANGLHDPIVLWQDQIIDGRNRLAACKIAKVEPTFESVAIDEVAVTAFVLSRNQMRRHLSKGQRAVCVSMVYAPDGEWSPGDQEHAALSAGVGTRTLRMATFVRNRTPEQIPLILNGKMEKGIRKYRSLNAAYEIAEGTNKAEEQARKEREAKEADLEYLTQKAMKIQQEVDEISAKLPPAPDLEPLDVDDLLPIGYGQEQVIDDWTKAHTHYRAVLKWESDIIHLVSNPPDLVLLDGPDGGFTRIIIKGLEAAIAGVTIKARAMSHTLNEHHGQGPKLEVIK